MGGGEGNLVGVLVPTVNAGETSAPAAGTEVVVVKTEEEEVDKDILCPICMQIIKDAFLTACGHSFCYMCIVTHLQNKSDCPCCSHYLTTNHLYPNFLLNKVNFLFFLKLFSWFWILARSVKVILQWYPCFSWIITPIGCNNHICAHIHEFKCLILNFTYIWVW